MTMDSLAKPQETIGLILSFLEKCRYLAAHEVYSSLLTEVQTVERTLQNKQQNNNSNNNNNSSSSSSSNSNNCGNKNNKEDNATADVDINFNININEIDINLEKNTTAATTAASLSSCTSTEEHLPHPIDLLSVTQLSEWLSETVSLLEFHKDKIALMVERMSDIRSALDNQDHDEKWVLGASHFGINTYYQYDESDSSLIIKMEGSVDDLPLFEQVAVIHEIDLFSTWVPFCTVSQKIDKIGAAEMITYMNIGIPPLSRDYCLHAYAADCLHESGKLIITGKSIEEYIKPLPLKPIGWFHNRMVVKQFKVITEIHSSTKAKSTIIAHINPRTALPQAFLNFIMKNMAGLILYLFQKQAFKVSNEYDCEHAQRIRSNKEFYVGWILPKLREFCDAKGWEQPIIASLGEEGIPETSG